MWRALLLAAISPPPAWPRALCAWRAAWENALVWAEQLTSAPAAAAAEAAAAEVSWRRRRRGEAAGCRLRSRRPRRGAVGRRPRGRAITSAANAFSFSHGCLMSWHLNALDISYACHMSSPQAQKEYPADMAHCKDKFLVQTEVLPPGEVRSRAIWGAIWGAGSGGAFWRAILYGASVLGWPRLEVGQLRGRIAAGRLGRRGGGLAGRNGSAARVPHGGPERRPGRGSSSWRRSMRRWEAAAGKAAGIGSCRRGVTMSGRSVAAAVRPTVAGLRCAPAGNGSADKPTCVSCGVVWFGSKPFHALPSFVAAQEIGPDTFKRSDVSAPKPRRQPRPKRPPLAEAPARNAASPRRACHRRRGPAPLCSPRSPHCWQPPPPRRSPPSAPPKGTKLRVVIEGPPAPPSPVRRGCDPAAAGGGPRPPTVGFPRRRLSA